MNLDDLTDADIAADVRLLLDAESVDDVTYDAEMHDSDRSRVVVTVGIEGEDRTRRFELWVTEVPV